MTKDKYVSSNEQDEDSNYFRAAYLNDRHSTKFKVTTNQICETKTSDQLSCSFTNDGDHLNYFNRSSNHNLDASLLRSSSHSPTHFNRINSNTNLNTNFNLSPTNHLSKLNHSSSHLNQSSNENSINHHSNELCGKIRHEIRHFTEEFKEKFIKKKRSPCLFKKNESNNSSDQEEMNDRKCVTRIKVNTNDEMDFLNLNNLSSNISDLSCQVTRNLSPSNLSFNNLSSHSLNSQTNLAIESRSPFINRALPPPPLPNKDYKDFIQKSRNSFCNLKVSKKLDFNDEKDKSNFKKSNPYEPINLNNHDSTDDDEESSELNITNCFKLYRDKEPKKNFKIKSIRNHLLPSKKYSHQPPHLHSLKSKVHKFDTDDDEEEDENNSNQANTFTKTTKRSLINLNSNLIHHHQSNASGSSFNNDNINNATNFLNSSQSRGDQHSSRNDEFKNEDTCSRNLISNENSKQSTDEQTKKLMDYSESIEKVKDQGWYWGPLSGEKAEKILEKEPEGSFIVRDSSDENYIFSLTFKLNNDIVHVRIEHDQGNFSFGSLQKFSSSTIVDFIREAVEYSRSGRYLFFLHRLPIIGPMRVQLLNPVSRFRNVQSLKHLSRFVILKHVRRDKIRYLPLPDKLINYLNEHNYFAEIK